MINWLLFSSFVFSMAMTVVGLMLDLTYELRYSPALSRYQEQQKARWPRFIEAEKTLLNHPVFAPRSRQKKDLSLKVSELTQGDRQTPLLDNETRKIILAMGTEWLKEKHKVEKLSPVESLFADIDEYDHWLISRPPSTTLATDLIVMTQVFLAYTYHYEPEAIREALQKTRHLSQILLSTEVMNLKRAGLSILEKEREFMSVLETRVLHARILWNPVSSRELKTYREHLLNISYFLSPLSSKEVLKKLFIDTPLPLGFCSVYFSKKSLLKWADLYMGSDFPLEPSFTETLSLLSQIKNKAGQSCLAGPDNKVALKKSWRAHLPFYRKIYALRTLLKAETTNHPL
jgi:hypothetical protein